MARRLPLPVRRSMSLTEEAYAQLRALHAEYGLGNNYLLTVLLENYDRLVDKDAERKIFAEFISEYGAPSKGEMGAASKRKD